MKPFTSYSPQNPKKHYTRLKKVLNNLEKMQKTFENSGETHKLSAVSLKILSSQLSQAYSPKPFLHSPVKKSKKHPKPVALDALELTNEILDNKDPKNKKFLTESMMRSRPIYAILHQRKRQFGFKTPPLPEIGSSFYPLVPNALTSRDVSRKLDAILYNNVYKNSKMGKRHNLIKRFEQTEITPLLFKTPTTRYSPQPSFKESDKLFIGQELKNIISQEELQKDLIKLRLSKYKHLKDSI